MGSQRAPRVRRKKRDEELEPELVPPQAAVPRAPAIPALELQRAAGNRAFGAALGRWPMWFSRPQGQWPKEPQVIVDGTTIPMVSFSWAESISRGAGGHGGGGPGKADMREMHISIRPGTHSAQLALGTAQGQHYETVIIVMPKAGGGYTVTLKDVLLTSFSAVGDVDTFTANFAKYEMGTSPPGP